MQSVVEFEHLKDVEVPRYSRANNGFLVLRMEGIQQYEYAMIDIITDEVHPFRLTPNEVIEQVRQITDSYTDTQILEKNGESLLSIGNWKKLLCC